LTFPKTSEEPLYIRVQLGGSGNHLLNVNAIGSLIETGSTAVLIFNIAADLDRLDAQLSSALKKSPRKKGGEQDHFRRPQTRFSFVSPVDVINILVDYCGHRLNTLALVVTWWRNRCKNAW
jgi:hypothetical protein